MELSLTKREARMIIEALTSKRNRLRREADYDGVTKTRRARMRLRANEMEFLADCIEEEL